MLRKKIVRWLFIHEVSRLEGLLTDMRSSYKSLIKHYEEYKGKYEKEIELYTALQEDYMDQIEREKIYVYLIPRLIKTSEIKIQDDFNVSNIEDLRELQKRYMLGDLREV